MTTMSDSEILTRVGPGTPMGNLMRQYWVPALKSSELAADGDPVRLRLMGENLIAFRDTKGKVGVMDHRCPHRCASLFFGRNEEGGIRCVYHGWKFDTEGNCLDMANVPPHQDFRHKVHAKAYRTAESAGVVWVYMGEAQELPPLPEIEAANLPDGEFNLIFMMRECNYMQALEGDIDTSHFGFLHAGSVKADTLPSNHPGRFSIVNRAPELAVVDTSYGTMYAGYRPADPGETHWRVAHFLMPFWTLPPDGAIESHVIGRAWVPIDDTHTMMVQWSWTKMEPSLRTDKNGNTWPGMVLNFDFVPNTTDWLGRWRVRQNEANDFEVDRDAQRKDQIYTGVTGIVLQDQMITTSMGAITDHDFEHLAPSDYMIARTRRRLILAAKAFLADGKTPDGVLDGDSYRTARAGDFVARNELKTLDEAYRWVMGRAVNPTGRLLAAE